MVKPSSSKINRGPADESCITSENRSAHQAETKTFVTIQAITSGNGSNKADMDLQDRRTWQFRGRCMGQLIDNIKDQKQVTWGPDDKIIMQHFLAKSRLCAQDVEDLPLKDLAKSLNILSVDDEEILAVEWNTIVGLTPYATNG
ncbi:hypothetical protein K4K59_009075 [Colletotrichum sp. SAR11_240]|nr:hypothetical protein K4K59_009075 [Colletotrichum sp. SAR11_240]